MDMIPEINVTVYREGEPEPSLPIDENAPVAQEIPSAGSPIEENSDTGGNPEPIE
jgi:hypothetical protein